MFELLGAIGVITGVAGMSLWFYVNEKVTTDSKFAEVGEKLAKAIANILAAIGLAVLVFDLGYGFFGKEECPNCEARHTILFQPNHCENCGYNYNYPECECDVSIEKGANFCERCGKEL